MQSVPVFGDETHPALSVLLVTSIRFCTFYFHSREYFKKHGVENLPLNPMIDTVIPQLTVQFGGGGMHDILEETVNRGKIINLRIKLIFGEKKLAR